MSELVIHVYIILLRDRDWFADMLDAIQKDINNTHLDIAAGLEEPNECISISKNCI